METSSSLQIKLEIFYATPTPYKMFCSSHSMSSVRQKIHWKFVKKAFYYKEILIQYLKDLMVNNAEVIMKRSAELITSMHMVIENNF